MSKNFISSAFSENPNKRNIENFLNTNVGVIPIIHNKKADHKIENIQNYLKNYHDKFYWNKAHVKTMITELDFLSKDLELTEGLKKKTSKKGNKELRNLWLQEFTNKNCENLKTSTIRRCMNRQRLNSEQTKKEEDVYIEKGGTIGNILFINKPFLPKKLSPTIAKCYDKKLTRCTINMLNTNNCSTIFNNNNSLYNVNNSTYFTTHSMNNNISVTINKINKNESKIKKMMNNRTHVQRVKSALQNRTSHSFPKKFMINKKISNADDLNYFYNLSKIKKILKSSKIKERPRIPELPLEQILNDKAYRVCYDRTKPLNEMIYLKNEFSPIEKNVHKNIKKEIEYLKKAINLKYTNTYYFLLSDANSKKLKEISSTGVPMIKGVNIIEEYPHEKDPVKIKCSVIEKEADEFIEKIKERDIKRFTISSDKKKKWIRALFTAADNYLMLKQQKVTRFYDFMDQMDDLKNNIYKDEILELFGSLKEGRFEEFRKLLEFNKFLLLVTDSGGQNVLHWLLKRKKGMHLIYPCVSNGANVNAKNLSWKTPLHVACELGLKDIICFLIYMGSNPYSKDGYGNIPFDYWQSEEDEPFKKKFLKVLERAFSIINNRKSKHYKKLLQRNLQFFYSEEHIYFKDWESDEYQIL